MASFPTGVKSFTTKQDGSGNTINAAHINDLQDEIAAIEDAYVNGTGRLNSSNSTLANLNVTGKSTFAGAVTWTGNSTFAAIQAQASTLATLQVTGVSTLASLQVTAGSTLATLQVTGASTFDSRPVMTPPHFALVYLDSTVTLGSSVLSTISWLAQGIVTNSSIHSSGSNPQRLTPQSTGVWRVSAQIEFATISVQRRVRIIDSSNTLIAEQTIPASATSNDLTVQVMGYKRFDALGGYVTCVHVSTAAPSTQSLSTGVGGTWFALEKL